MSKWIPTLLVGGIVAVAACADNPSAAVSRADALPSARRINAAGFVTSQPPQARAVVPYATLKPILSSGDILPGSGEPWAPTPDGLGAYAARGKLVVFANHELTAAGVLSSNGGAPFRFARVSKLTIDPWSLSVVDGGYVEDGSTGLIRLCSATWVGALEGFPTGYFFTGEEQGGTPNGSTVMAYDRNGNKTFLHQFGAFLHENTIAVPGFPHRVVVMGFDDNTGASELYMYVAESERDAIEGRGKLYVLKTDVKTASGTSFHSGNLREGLPIDGYFVEVSDPADLGTAPAARSTNLQNKVDALGAMPFVRIEDGDYDKNSPYSPAIYFVDTGNSGVTGRAAVNADCFGVCDLAGSLYRLEWKSRNPLGGVRLRLVERSRGAATGWASPDNIATTRQSLMMQEDPAYSGFDGSRPPAIWHFRLLADGRKVGTAKKVVEVTQETLIPGPTGKCVDALGQCWESSGIISTEDWLGPGTWLFDVQAHTLPFTVTRNGTTSSYVNEGGQLLYLRLPGS
jgi:hypothetical protein